MTDLNALESLFLAALERPPAERAAFLDTACADAELRGRVDRLLAAAPNLGGCLEGVDATGPLQHDLGTRAAGLEARRKAVNK